MTQNVIFDTMFCTVCIVNMAVLFIACGIIVFLRRKRKADWLKIAAGIVMGICFLIFMFLLWCVIGFGGNVPDTDPQPSGYRQISEKSMERDLVFEIGCKIPDHNFYKHMR